MLGFLAFTILLKLICICSANDLPSYFPKCTIDDPDLNGCILKATDQVREYIKKGIPELAIPSVDPLFVPQIEADQGIGAVNFKITLTNATITGLGDYHFNEFTYDPKALTFHGFATFKSLTLASKYEVNGKILVAPIRGTGDLKITLGASTGTLDVKGELVKRKGEEYYNPADIKAVIVLGNTKSSFDGIFDGNEQLALATKDLLRDHSDELVKEITPAIEKVAEELFRRILLGINKHVPYNKLFLPSH